MAELAPGPIQRAQDDGGLAREKILQSKKRAPRKSKMDLFFKKRADAPALMPEVEAEPDTANKLDVLA